jgi:tRNA(fMet)-specific endonuclease VapC
MYLLDTDSVTNGFDLRRSQPYLRARIEAEPLTNLHVSMITVGEICRGWLDAINQARKHPRDGAKVVAYYSLFQRHFEDVQRFRLLPYDEAAEAAYSALPAEIRKQHSLDCHIAATAMTRGLIVVTSNLRHFQRIPGLQCEDWTLAEDGSE